jgi:hypothetical protein
VALGSGVSLEIPDADGWRAGGGRDWIRLVHPESDTELELTRFSAEPSVQPAACAARAGISLGAEPAESASLLDRRALTLENDLRVEFAVSASNQSGGSGLVGAIDAAAAGIRVCVGLRLRTLVAGREREAELGKRLALYAERSIPSLALDRAEQRVTAPAAPDFDSF